MIPIQLQKKSYRFIFVGLKSKNPQEKSWTTTNNYKYNDTKLKQWITENTNYGICCGFGNLAVLDCDKEELSNLVIENLPKTFVVQTGSGGKHYYYKIKNLTKKIIINKEQDEKPEHLGELQWKGQYVVAPNSIHPNGETYKIVDDSQIATITKKDIDKLLSIINPPQQEKEKHNWKKQTGNGLQLSIAPLIGRIENDYNIELKQHSDGQYWGEHPIHGSETGQNFWINPEKNCWRCFRCESGGDTLTLIAMLNGIIKCEDCKNTPLKDLNKFNETTKIAKEKYGYKTNINIDQTKLLLEKYKVMSWSRFGKQINYTNLVNLILNESGYTFISLYDGGKRRHDIYYYENGIYKNEGELIVANLVKQYLKEDTTTRAYNEVISLLGHECHIERENLNISDNLINLKNGIYDLNTKQLIPHSPGYYFLSQIPVNYNPNAKCKNIQKFLHTVLKNQEDVDKMQEFIGYCLYRAYPIQKMFILFGSGGNGKSVTTNIIEAMIGKENSMHQSLHNLCSKNFAASELYEKYVNVGTDMRYEDLVNTETLKELVGEDRLTADIKFKSPINFVNHAKLIFNTNNIPFTKDNFQGFYRRIIILDYLKTFKGKNIDVELTKKLTTKEGLEGLLIWSLEGLHRLLSNGKFTGNDDPEILEEQYEERVNFEVDWLKSNYVVGIGQSTFDSIYKKYSEEISELGLPIKTRTRLAMLIYTTFGKDKLQSPQFKVIRHRMHGKNYTVYQNFVEKSEE